MTFFIQIGINSSELIAFSNTGRLKSFFNPDIALFGGFTRGAVNHKLII